MKAIAESIRQTILEHASLIGNRREEELARKPAPTKWSKREILGHLVDSAQNNLQRFVRGQYEDTPAIVYNQDEWVQRQHYQRCDDHELLQLWILLNRHLCHVLEAMDPAHYEKKCNVGKGEASLQTLKFLAEDYLVHMKHHLHQIVNH